MTATWKNWSGSVSCQPARIAMPHSEEEIASVVRETAEKRLRVRVCGTGHSFVPLCATDDVLVSLDEFQGIEAVDRATGEATIRAGTKIHNLGGLLAEHGLALENQGDVDVQAIAGAVSTGTHGTGPTLGNISTQVVGLRIVTATGEVLECSPTSHPEVLRAGRVALGAFGVLSHVRIKALPLYRLHEVCRRETLDDCLASLERRSAANRHFEFFWYPADDCAFTKTLNPTDLPATMPAGDSIQAGAGLASTERERVGEGWRIFPTVRENKFNEMEYSLPAERGVACFLEVRDLMRRKHTDATWPIEYRTQAADDIPISAAQGRATVAISIHQGAELRHQAFFADAEVIFRRHQGRPHWGKMHSLACRNLRELYPLWDDFQRVRAKLDPEGRFMNEHLRRLFVE